MYSCMHAFHTHTSHTHKHTHRHRIIFDLCWRTFAHWVNAGVHIPRRAMRISMENDLQRTRETRLRVLKTWSNVMRHERKRAMLELITDRRCALDVLEAWREFVAEIKMGEVRVGQNSWRKYQRVLLTCFSGWLSLSRLTSRRSIALERIHMVRSVCVCVYICMYVSMVW